MLYEIIFYGRGGQGGVTAANILVHAALYQKLHAQGFPFFGAERRGAPVMAFSRISDKPIFRHGMFYEADIIIVLDHKLIEIGATKKVSVRDNGYVIINMPDNYEIDYDKFNITGKAKFYGVDAKRIALENKLIVAGWPVVNTSMLGAFSKATQIIEIENIMKAIKSYFGGRIGETNAKAAFQAYNETRLVKEVNK